MTIYRYGPLAWVWRLFLLGFIAGALGLLWAAGPTLVVLTIAAVLLAPSLFFGAIVVTSVDRHDDGRLRVWTLLWLRQVYPSQIGTAKVRKTYQTESSQLYAPRLWVRVHGRLPLYFDLLARIPDRRLFATTFRIPVAALPGR